MTELEKAADNYTEKAENILKYSDGWEEYSDWEYVKKAYINGANWMKGWIMNNATLLNSRILPTNIEENEFCLDDFDEDEVDVITKAVNNKKFKCGDKVKLIIIMEE